MTKFYEGQKVCRIDGSDQPEMVKGNIYTVTYADAMQQFIKVAEAGDRLWNTSAFDPNPDGTK